MHLTNAKEWGNLWDIIYNDSNCRLQSKLSIKYRTTNNKITKLTDQQKAYNTPINNTRDKHVHMFAKRTVNLTNVVFTKVEIHILDKGLKYNLHHTPKNWIQTLAMQAKVGKRQLPKEDQAYFRQAAANN
jgi:hypothetical protein